jgi:hypothetical protein
MACYVEGELLDHLVRGSFQPTCCWMEEGQRTSSVDAYTDYCDIVEEPADKDPVVLFLATSLQLLRFFAVDQVYE